MTSIQNIDWHIVATIAATLLAACLGAFINRAIESRSRLIAYLGHVSAHSFSETGSNKPPHDIYTHSVVLRNLGRKSAINVCLTHFYLPDFKVFPDIDHEVKDLPGGGKEIVFPTLVPSEQVTISYLYFPPLTWNQVNNQIKSEEGFAKFLRVLPTQQYPKWLTHLVLGLMLVGLVSVI